MEIDYWFRHPLPKYYSIENVFKGIENELNSRENILIREHTVPFTTSSLKNLYLNRRYAKTEPSTSKINHITGDIYYMTSALKGARIVTVHDLVLNRRKGNYLKKKLLQYLWYKQPLRSADLVTVISPQIKKEVLELGLVPIEKIKVIPNFYHPFFDTLREKKIRLGQPMVLFIGTNENKNLSRALDALSGTGIGMNLVGHPGKDDMEKISHSGVKVVLFKNLSIEALGELYQTSSCLLFPSLYEGFGLPIIEAQAAGLPVITSNFAPMNWVADAGAILVDPYDTDAIKSAVLQVSEDEVGTAARVLEGFTNIQRFRLAKVADQYLSCYQLCS